MARHALPWLLLVWGAALAQPQRHDRIVAVPAPTTVAVDGDLADWDLSGAIHAAFDDALRPKFSLRLGLMYDAQALYVAAHVADHTPLRNRHDPAVEPDKGWAGDALQLRLCSDPKAPYPLPNGNGDRIVHLTMWQFAERKLPVRRLWCAEGCRRTTAGATAYPDPPASQRRRTGRCSSSAAGGSSARTSRPGGRRASSPRVSRARGRSQRTLMGASM